MGSLAAVIGIGKQVVHAEISAGNQLGRKAFHVAVHVGFAMASVDEHQRERGVSKAARSDGGMGQERNAPLRKSGVVQIGGEMRQRVDAAGPLVEEGGIE